MQGVSRRTSEPQILAFRVQRLPKPGSPSGVYSMMASIGDPIDGDPICETFFRWG